MVANASGKAKAIMALEPATKLPKKNIKPKIIIGDIGNSISNLFIFIRF